MDQVQIKIVKSGTGLRFPYGFLTKADADFVADSVGKVFTAERVHMNAYRTACGHKVHIYNALEVSKQC